MNFQDLHLKVKTIYAEKEQGLPCMDYPATASRLTRSRLKDLSTHIGYIGAALGRPAPELVPASELNEENLARVRQFLVEQKKGRSVIENSLTTFKFLRDLAIECGVPIVQRQKLERRPRGRVYEFDEDGKARKVARQREGNWPEYGHRYKDWNDDLKADWADYADYMTNPLRDHRNAKMVRPVYLNQVRNRAERMLGFLILKGVAPDRLRLRMLTNPDNLFAYRNFLYERRGNRDTITTKGDLDQWRELALNYYEDEATAEIVAKRMRRLSFETVKDKDEMVQRVHADDLYTVAKALIAEAEHYTANLKRKHSRKWPEATMAYHWMCAAVWSFTLATMLRERNVVEATNFHLYKQNGEWHFRFRAGEMKGPRAKGDQVVDLWEGDAFQTMIDYVLDKAVQMRPHLLNRFRAENIGKSDPDAFFLNSEGRPWTKSGMRMFFNSASVKYIGPDKRISPHHVRTIVPSYLFVREGTAILPTVQRYLDHANLTTTQQHYLRIESLFSAKLAKMQMEERAKQRKAQEKLAKLPDVVVAMMGKLSGDILEQIGEHFDPATLGKAVQDAVRAELARHGTDPAA